MRRHMRWLAIVALGVAVTMGARLAAQQPAEITLRAAREAAAIRGDLPRAAALYEQAIVEAGGRGPVAAEATVGLGMTYQKLGRAEAPAILARVGREFADQPAAVAAARAALQAVEMTPRRWYTDEDFPNSFTPDGQSALVVSTAGILLRNLHTRSTATLVPASTLAWGQFPVMSPDARQVAYAWFEQPPRGTPGVGTRALRVIGTERGATPRNLLAPHSDVGAHPIGWSPDGTSVLTYRLGAQSASLVWVSVADGATRPIASFGLRQGPRYSLGFVNVDLSPDGSTIAYSAVVAQGASDRYLYTMDANGQSPATVVRMAGENIHPVWASDGAHLLFINERSGQRGLWAVGMRGGNASGEPFLVQGNFAGRLIDMTRLGELFYVVENAGGFAEFIAERHPTGSRIVQTFAGMSGSWSRGNRLAFFRIGARPIHDLIVRSMATGEERSYPRPGGFGVQQPRWLHDDSGLIIFLNEKLDGQPGGGFHRLDLATGTLRRLFDRNTPEHVRSAGVLVAPDNRMIYTAVRKDPKSPWSGMVAIDLETGAERPLLTFPGEGLSIPQDGAPAYALSPDVRTIAITVPVEGSTTRVRLITVGIDGSNWREIHTYDHEHWVDILRWTPDGQSLLFVARPVDVPTWRMMRIPAAGGVAEFDGLDSAAFVSTVPLPKIRPGNVANFEVSPDGTRVAFGSFTESTYELWTLDNVLASLNSR